MTADHFPGLVPLTHKYMTADFPGLVPLTHKYMTADHFPGLVPLTHRNTRQVTFLAWYA